MEQGSQHDWLGEMAELYVMYLASRAGFDAYGGSKWAADVAIHVKEQDKWIRVEVRSTDSKDRPKKKGCAKLCGKAEVVADVTMPKVGHMDVLFVKLTASGQRETDCRISNPSDSQLRDWILKLCGVPASVHGVPPLVTKLSL